MSSPTLTNKASAWGLLAGIIVTAIVAIPLSATIAFATHPDSRLLFDGRLAEVSPGLFSLFWWIASALLVALPICAGIGVAKLSPQILGIIGAVVVLLLIALIVVGQLVV